MGNSHSGEGNSTSTIPHKAKAQCPRRVITNTPYLKALFQVLDYANVRIVFDIMIQNILYLCVQL